MVTDELDSLNAPQSRNCGIPRPVPNPSPRKRRSTGQGRLRKLVMCGMALTIFEGGTESMLTETWESAMPAFVIKKRTHHV
jgi:hypothetical protein